MRLLQYLAERREAVSLAEFADSLDLPKPTAHRLCAMLLDMGMIARNVDEKSFVIGPALRSLAFDVLNHGTLSGFRHRILEELVDDVGETCNFTALDGASVVYIDRVEAPQPWRLTLDVGAHVPLHCTASGKLFLAMLPPARRDYLLRRLSLERMTPNTLTDAGELNAELDRIKANGYATDREEFVIGLVAFAVPVYDPEGNLRAALAMHAPLAHLTHEEALQKLSSLHRAAERMRELL